MRIILSNIKTAVWLFLKQLRYWIIYCCNSINDFFYAKENSVCLFDTSIGTKNKGDNIINLFCKKELSSCFPSSDFVCVPTHFEPDSSKIKKIRSSKTRIVCGTNILSHNVKKYSLWKFTQTLLGYHNIVPMGIGWGCYSPDTSIESKMLYRCIFSKRALLSVRDSYTEEKMRKMGFKNVINTGCPTLWGLTPEHCKTIPQNKADNVITTLTDYAQDSDRDLFLLNVLSNYYSKVYLWIQGTNDLEYFNQLHFDKEITLINGPIDDFTHLLDMGNIDYVGSRLHAGILSMNHSVRSIIIALDNRAKEMGKDFNLPIIPVELIRDELEQKINSVFSTNIILPWENINKWKNQFVKPNR